MADVSVSPAAVDKVGTVSHAPADNPRPLCVDLDGTLVATDTLLEATLGLLRRRPAAALQLPVWLARGRAGFKSAIAARHALDVTGLPYRAAVLETIRQAREQGRQVLLTTASHRATAEAVAAHLGLFDAVLATDERVNLKGRFKLAAIQGAIGQTPFDYVGDGCSDLPVLRAAHTAYLVAPSRSVQAALPGAQVLVPAAGGAWWPWVLAMRPTQWAKNLLLAVPLLVGWQLGDPWRWGALAVAGVAFCLAASSVYLVNDVFDLAADRAHPTKRRRPLAAGRVSPGLALLAAPLLVGLALAISVAALPWSFTAVLAMYLALTAAYSWFVKERAVLDVLWLAGLYTLRIIAGGEAVDIVPSAWLLAFSMFLFLSLALAKRYAELARIHTEGGQNAAGRGYRTSDLPLIESAGVAAGYLTVLILALYVNSPTVGQVYRHPALLWLACPVVLFWITRLWLVTHRGNLREDPLTFALRDRVSYLAGAILLLLAWWAR